MSTGKNVLTAFGGVEGYITLALELGGTLVPLAKGLVSEIRAVAAGGKTTSYTVLVQLDSSELDAIDKLSRDDLAAINAELEKLGVPAVPVPPEAPPADASNS